MVDVIDADVHGEGDAIVLTARTDVAVPHSLKTSALEFRWDLAGDDAPKWSVVCVIDTTTRVSVFSDEGFGAGTVDETFPGIFSLRDDTVEIRLRPAALPDFPTSFEWNLATTVRAFRKKTDSPRVQDLFPDEGAIRHSS
ncbi:MAG: hypothetical protein M3198_19105 [Actinomycetota bacterium]|nr:hypothetical protein [Actinomycetota bacterium]